MAPCRLSKESVIPSRQAWGVCRHGRSRALRRLQVQVGRASVRAVGARRGLHQGSITGNKKSMPLQELTKEQVNLLMSRKIYVWIIDLLLTFLACGFR